MSFRRLLGSLRTQIIVWSLVPTVIILGAMILFTFYTYRQVTEHLVMERNLEMTRLVARQISLDMSQYAEILDDVVNVYDAASFVPTVQYTGLGWSMEQLRVFDAGVVVLDDSGTVVATDPRRPEVVGQNWSDRSYFEPISSGDSAVFGWDIENDGPDGAQVIPIARPIRGDEGGIWGVIMGMFHLEGQTKSAFHRSLSKLRLRIGPVMKLVDGRGRAMYHPSPDQIGHDISGQPAVQSVLGGWMGAQRTHNLDGQEVVVSYVSVPDTSWSVVVEESWANLTQVSAGGERVLLVLVALGLCALLLAVVITSGRIVRPIARFTSAARRMADGDLNQVITVHQGGELAELASAFNRMSSELQEWYADLERKVAERTRELSTLNMVANVVSGSLNLEEILNAALGTVLAAMGWHMGVAYRLDEDQQTLTLMAHQGVSQEFVRWATRVPVWASVAGEAILRGRPVVKEVDAYTESDFKQLVRKEGIRMATGIPLVAKGKKLGGVSLGSRIVRAVTPEELSFLAAIGNQISLAVENARLHEEAERVAVAAERSRLARELHDSVTQTLFSANLIAGVLPILWEQNPDEAPKQMEELHQLTQGALAEMRTLLLELRPAALAQAPLAEVLRHLTEATAGRARVPVDLSVEGEPDLPPDVRVALYRIAQEALNNVVKHAQPTRAWVSLRCEPSSRGAKSAELCIGDDGGGFDTFSMPEGHLGLAIMRERAESIGAALEIRSEPGHGTQVTVRWKEEADAEM